MHGVGRFLLCLYALIHSLTLSFSIFLTLTVDVFAFSLTFQSARCIFSLVLWWWQKCDARVEKLISSYRLNVFDEFPHFLRLARSLSAFHCFFFWLLCEFVRSFNHFFASFHWNAMPQWLNKSSSRNEHFVSLRHNCIQQTKQKNPRPVTIGVSILLTIRFGNAACLLWLVFHDNVVYSVDRKTSIHTEKQSLSFVWRAQKN